MEGGAGRRRGGGERRGRRECKITKYILSTQCAATVAQSLQPRGFRAAAVAVAVE